MSNKRMTKDIQIIISNTELTTKVFNLWDYLHDKKDFIVGHLLIVCSDLPFFDNVFPMDKEYLLHNYYTANDNRQALIYNFDGGYFLAPLKHKTDITKPIP